MEEFLETNKIKTLAQHLYSPELIQEVYILCLFPRPKNDLTGHTLEQETFQKEVERVLKTEEYQ